MQEDQFKLALLHHQAGRLAQAENIYRQILAREPRHAHAMHYLGVIAYQSGQHDAALDLIRQAIALLPPDALAMNNLGNVLKAKRRFDEAITAYQSALALRPAFPEAQNNLGTALKEKGMRDPAIACYRAALALRPNYADACSNLGDALVEKGQLDEAIAAFEKTLALRPDYPEIHYRLGIALQRKGRVDQAIAVYRQATIAQPASAQAHNDLANALLDRGQFTDAIVAYRRAISLNPGFSALHSNLGTGLRANGQLDEAIEAFSQALNLDPTFAGALNNLGLLLSETGRADEAIVTLEQALSLRPDYAEAQRNLAITLHKIGRLDEAIVAYRKAIALDPQNAAMSSALLFCLQYHPDYDARAIADEHSAWNARQAAPLQKLSRPHLNDPDPHRRLRVGFVSADFRDHVVGRNVLPLFAHHDRAKFEITCYAHVRSADAITREFQRHSNHWREIFTQPDDQLAMQIREDGIDVLVDLALHTAGNHLLVFARKPAPVQVTFAGYPASTGLTAMDYRLSDPYLDPPGMDESVYSERTVRLPRSFWCYDPLDQRDILVNSLPAIQNGFITFGCLNNFCKINSQVLSLWAQVMRECKGSRLLLLSWPGSHRDQTIDRMRQEGIEPGRIEFIAPVSRGEYLELYHRIDLGLDPFPYNGHTTSLDSFWMGVPVVTCVGNRSVARGGWSQLSNLGLAELAGHTHQQFAEIAIALAHDLPRLCELRATLRRTMEQSPLMDGPIFARDIERSLRQMWIAWCDSQRAT